MRCVFQAGRVRDPSCDLHAHSGICTVGDHRFQRAGIHRNGFVVRRAFVGDQAFPFRYCFIPIFTLWCKGTSVKIFKSRIVGRHHACACAAFDGHIADGHALFHRQGAHGLAGIFEDVSRTTADTDPGNECQNYVLGRDAFRQGPIDPHFIRFGFGLQQTLRSKYVFHFGGANSKGKRAESAVGGSMTIAAYNRETRLGEPKLRAYHVDDPTLRAVHAI